MTASKGLGTYGNAVGVVTPLDHKLALSGLVTKAGGNAIRAGLFWGGNANIIVGKANMSYDVIAFTGALSRGASSGTTLGANDGTYNVTTTAAPGSNSRIDIIYWWQREYALDGTDSNPVIGVVQGTAAASPTAPSLAAFPGAIELGRATVGAGITATTSATITQTAPFTATAGGTVPFRTSAERDLVTTLPKGTTCVVLSDLSEAMFSGSVWAYTSSAFISYTPVLVNIAAGSGGIVSTKYKYENGLIRVQYMFKLGTSPTVNPNAGFSLPVTAAALKHPYMIYPGNGSHFDDSATATRISMVAADNASTTNVRLAHLNNVSGLFDYLSSTAPWTWAINDVMWGEFTYVPA